MEDLIVDKKGVLRAMGFAILIAFLGIGILGWQYHQLEKKKIPLLEEEIAKQKETMEERLAESVLEKFMLARIGRREAQALAYLTERAMEQKRGNEFSLINKFEDYEILAIEKLEENKFRGAVKIYEEERKDFVEVIILIKILDKYYIDSVEIAG